MQAQGDRAKRRLRQGVATPRGDRAEGWPRQRAVVPKRQDGKQKSAEKAPNDPPIFDGLTQRHANFFPFPQPLGFKVCIALRDFILLFTYHIATMAVLLLPRKRCPVQSSSQGCSGLFGFCSLRIQPIKIVLVFMFASVVGVSSRTCETVPVFYLAQCVHEFVFFAEAFTIEQRKPPIFPYRRAFARMDDC